MSTFQARALLCPGCARAFQAQVYSSVSTDRQPQLIERVLARELQASTCPSCGAVCHAEQPLLYMDLAGRLYAHVLPEAERARWEEHETLLPQTLQRVFAEATSPPIVRQWGAALCARVVFGYEELREKVLAHQEGLHDGVLEALKLQLFLQLPELLAGEVWSLSLESRSAAGALCFVALDAGGAPLSQVELPESAWRSALAQRTPLEQTYPALFRDPWCNMLRYRL